MMESNRDTNVLVGLRVTRQPSLEAELDDHVMKQTGGHLYYPV
jgi:hypothetical protein